MSSAYTYKRRLTIKEFAIKESEKKSIYYVSTFGHALLIWQFSNSVKKMKCMYACAQGAILKTQYKH